MRENLDILIDSLLRAWGQHGASRELYVDNAKIYHASALKLACTERNIKLLHRPPREPEPGGLIERFFQTLQMQLEQEVRASQILSLHELNRVLAAWLEVDYHQRVHSETGQSPRQRYDDGTRFTRQVDLNAAMTFFHQREPRTVNQDHLDVRVGSVYFAVDPKLRGDRLLVQYDPFSPMDEVQLYSQDGAYLGLGRRYQREKGEHPGSQQPSDSQRSEPITPHYLDALRHDHEQSKQRSRQEGFDYHSARQRNAWSLTGFATHTARLLGRKGGASGLSADEMKVLAAFHASHDRLNESLLKEAFQRADSPRLAQILFHLQILLQERDL